jgi:hypothetical protein
MAAVRVEAERIQAWWREKRKGEVVRRGGHQSMLNIDRRSWLP